MGDRSQTWTKVSSSGVLLKNIAITIFAKNPIRRVFPHLVTICLCRVHDSVLATACVMFICCMKESV